MNAPGKVRVARDQPREGARREMARRDHPDEAVGRAQRQHAGPRRIDQAAAGERTGGARHVVQQQAASAEPGCERGEIVLLGDDSAGDQHPVGAGAQVGGATLRPGQRLRRQQSANAIDFRTGGWLRGSEIDDVAGDEGARSGLRPLREATTEDEIVPVRHHATPRDATDLPQPDRLRWDRDQHSRVMSSRHNQRLP